MEEFGSETLKPTMHLSNSKALARLNSKRKRGQVKRATGKRLCRKYLNKKGKRAFAGTRALKLSQNLIEKTLLESKSVRC